MVPPRIDKAVTALTVGAAAAAAADAAAVQFVHMDTTSALYAARRDE